jgi:hypothetical protein
MSDTYTVIVEELKTRRFLIGRDFNDIEHARLFMKDINADVNVILYKQIEKRRVHER